jgi:sulfate adenylyltransferase
LKVLFVCTANICRSAYAEVVARQVAPAGLTFASAGVRGRVAEPMEPLMAAQATARGASTESFRSQSLSMSMVDEADVVLTAESLHRRVILEERPVAMRKAFTFGQFVRGLDELDGWGADVVDQVRSRAATSTVADDVADPYRRGPEAFEVAAAEIDRLLGRILPALGQA